MSNFKFLNRVNENLFIIAQEAEKLFRDGYFEQCITQTRRLGENILRDLMAERIQSSDTFDDMLATLKDTPAQNDFEKEFIEDLYFLKKAGNDAVHSMTVNQDGNAALDCLQRAFEASINYAVFKKGADAKLLKLMFDEKLLATGKRGKKSSIKERYEELEAFEEFEEAENKKSKSARSNKKTRTSKVAKVFRAKKKTNKKDTDYENDSQAFDSDKKPLWREVLETIGAGLIIAVVYFLIFNK